jgi:transposase
MLENSDVLNQLIVENKSLTIQVEEYRQAYDRLQHQLKDLLRNRFGSKSEKFIDSENPQGDLFTTNDLLTVPPLDDEVTEVQAHSKRKRKAKNTSHYPRTIEIIPVSDEDKLCVCGCEKTVIRYEIKELYDYQPAIFSIIEQRREVVACKKGCDGAMKTAPAPLHILPKIKATESLLAHIIVSKLHDRQPLYHLEKYGRAIDMSRETMARWLIALVAPLQPLFNLMKESIIDYDVASLDATTLQVLKEPGREATKKSYAYCFRGGPPDQEVVLYAYNHEKHKLFVDQWFDGFSGSIHMDADPFFGLLLEDKAVFSAFCHAHARRYFEKVKKQSKKQGLAHEALRYYKKLYKIERSAKEAGLSPEARKTLRQEESRPLMIEFKAWLDKHAPLVLPQSPLGKAFNYVIKYWEGLSLFLDDGRLEIDNNLTEQEIKPLVIARKNFMFADSMDGAHALCLHLSFVRTALKHTLDPFQYYVAIMKKIPSCKTVEDYEALLPWNITLN